MMGWPDSSTFWRNKRVLVTGSAGFLGSFVVEKLHQRGTKEVFVPRSRDYDLVHREAVERVYRDARPEIVIHLAARVGGVGANRVRTLTEAPRWRCEGTRPLEWEQALAPGSRGRPKRALPSAWGSRTPCQVEPHYRVRHSTQFVAA